MRMLMPQIIVCYRAPIVRSIAALLLSLLAATGAFAQDVLFPTPLHITRQITDPIAGSKTITEDYCQGNRVVTISGRRTAIAEYDRGVLTVIDFEAGTYSITKFDDLAKAWSGLTPTTPGTQWQVAQDGDTTEARRGKEFVRMSADPRLHLSRAAAEVLLGIAYPNRPDPAADVLLNALKASGALKASEGLKASEDYGLPREQVMRHEIDGEVIETHNLVLRVGNELPPPELLAIPKGAKLVESDVTAARKMLDALDRQ